MSRLNSRITIISFAAFAAAMIFCAAPSHKMATALSDPAPENLSARDGRLSDNPDFILFRRGALDTRARYDLDTSAGDRIGLSSLSGPTRRQIRVVQFFGPVRRAWFEQLKSTGAEIIGYIPNNAYIIRGESRQLARVAELDAGPQASDARPIRWMGRIEPIQKIAPELYDLPVAKFNSNLNVEIELLDSPQSSETIAFINRVASFANHPPRRFLKFAVLSVSLSAESLLDIASLDDVMFINPSAVPSLHDELSAQIVAGNLLEDLSRPYGPGYMEWLESKGLNGQSDFLIDFTDGGLDKGSTAAGLVHPGSRDLEGRSRVAYNIDYTIDSQPEDVLGHGSMVASIAVGMGFTSLMDAEGYMYGLGVEPRARFGQSKIFENNGFLSTHNSFTEIVSAAYQKGARISNNSWGNNSNLYDSFAQEYDARARDAQPTVSGNQEMTFIFSAGNKGPGGNISSPGTAKNVITVGASESYRPEGEDSCNLDGQGAIGPNGADNALDILRFSAGGPVSDGRAKPDIAAPGTHIFGAASQATFFGAGGLCPGRIVYQPPGQRLYTWSSGTSLAAPHVTGAAALVRKFLALNDLLGDETTPSPAMTKAFLLNSASYMTGEHAGDDFPSQRQGWGLINLARAFDDGRRILVDQTELFTESGQTFEIKGSLADRSRPLRVTLVWTDAPGMLAGPALVNDLDLEISVGEEVIYRGNNFAGQFSTEGGEPDKLNNVEAIYLPAEVIPEGAEGNFTITVRAANIAGDGLPGNESNLDQDFALVVYNIADPVDAPPPKVIPAIAEASYVKKVLTITGRDFSAAARVEINGQIVDRPFTFDAATNSLSIRKKRRKLFLNKNSDNRIVIIENDDRSPLFILKL